MSTAVVYTLIAAVIGMLVPVIQTEITIPADLLSRAVWIGLAAVLLGAISWEPVTSRERWTEGPSLPKQVTRVIKTCKLLILSSLFVLLIPSPAFAYIGPDPGFVLAGSFFAILTAVFTSAFLLLTWPVRWLARVLRGRHALARARVQRVVILGLDGLDYRLTERLLSEGKLPNLAALRDQGCFKPLATTGRC